MKSRANQFQHSMTVLLAVSVLMVLVGGSPNGGHRSSETQRSGAVRTEENATIRPLPLLGAEGVPLAVDPDHEWVSRVRISHLDLDGLRERLIDSDHHAVDELKFELPFFADATFLAQTRRVEQRGDDRFTWIARIVDPPGGNIIMSVHTGAAYGMVNIPGRGQFEFHPLPEQFDIDAEIADMNGAYVIREIDPDRLPGCGVGSDECVNRPEFQLPGAANHHAQAGPTGHGNRSFRRRGVAPMTARMSASGESPTVRVMLAHTPAARKAVGGHKAMLAFIDAVIAQTNLAYEDSFIDLHAELALAHEVDYVGSGTMSTDLTRITTPGNGHMDEVHELRVAHQADLVALLLTYNSGFCGLAWCMGTPSLEFASKGFSVTRIECVPNLTFPHELGHNMGCHHDHDSPESECGTYPYSFGHRFFGNSGAQYRTIMATGSGQRIPYFSNPEVNHDGQPTGVPIGKPDEAHNVETITLNTPIFTAFAEQLQPNVCDLPGATLAVPDDLPTIQQAIDAAAHCDRIDVAPGVYYEAIDFNGRIVELRSTDGPEATVIDASGLAASVVRFTNEETPAAVIDGFTLRGGNATFGGGIFANQASPTIRNCIVTDNAASFGGGMCHFTAAPTIESSLFVNNTASMDGGAIYNLGASPIIVDSSFVSNQSFGAGGAIANQTSDVVIQSSTFEDNEAETLGGAIANLFGNSVSITGSHFRDNMAGNSGGAISGGDELSIAESLFCGNEPNHIDGGFDDQAGNVFKPLCQIPGDLNGDKTVGILDLLILLESWGQCQDCQGCPVDLDEDCHVDVIDLLILLENWG